MANASSPLLYSPRSFRVTTITDLVEQGVPLEDVQRPAGHADPRTTRLYDRRREKNLKEYCREDFGLKLSGFISLYFTAVSSIALKLVGMWNDESVGMGNLCKSLK